MPLNKHLFNYVSNGCFNKRTIEKSESMFLSPPFPTKLKILKLKYLVTEECHCLLLKADS